jgi:SRSO17 transposase
LETYAQRFDALFSSLAQRRGLRDYLRGLLLPRDRNKTLTGLAGAVPISGAQHREVQRLQWFLTESTWDHEVVNDQRVRLMRSLAAGDRIGDCGWWSPPPTRSACPGTAAGTC